MYSRFVWHQGEFTIRSKDMGCIRRKTVVSKNGRAIDVELVRVREGVYSTFVDGRKREGSTNLDKAEKQYFARCDREEKN